MRVVAGTQKGRHLKHPQGWDCRPTSARVREALFSILSPHVAGARVLDLYAGTGALGIESLSRGARRVVFVESQAKTAWLLRENIERCGYTRQCVVLTRAVETFLTAPPAWNQPLAFDIVVADPPYQRTDLTQLLERLSVSGTLAPDGRAILEHGTRHPVPTRVGSLAQTRQARYGDTTLTFYQRRPEAEVGCE